MRTAWLLAASFTAALAAGSAAAQTDLGASRFQRCAACHLSNGQGVPGLFPPLDAHLGLMADQTEGRQYLIMVLTRGMTGAIDVGGHPYKGVMPAQNLSASDAAAVLNHVLTTFSAKALHGGWTRFSEAEVTRVRTQLSPLQAGDLQGLRAAIRAK